MSKLHRMGKPPPRIRAILLVLFAPGIFESTHAANIAWSRSAPTNGDWHSAANWTGGVLPSTADNVTMSSGSSVVSAASTISYLELSSANLTLSRNAANLTVKAPNSGVNYGFYMANGTFSVLDGAKLNTSIGSPSEKSVKSAYLGNGGVATVLVSGTGSTATFSQRVVLYGASGSNLTIRDGGTMNAGSTQIGGTNLEASVLVDNSTFNAGTNGSLFSGVGSFNIGNLAGSTGHLTITNNGVVTNGAAAASIGNIATAIGTVVIDSGSWTSSSHIEIGGNGKGDLNIIGGTVSDSIGYIGRYVGSEGVVNLNGTGTWKNSGSIYIGNQGAGTLNFSGNGANLTTGASSTNYIANSAVSTGIANLKNGAVWTLQNLTGGSGTSTVNFNDATLKANKTRADFVTKITIMNLLAGGAVIDSNGFNIGITQTGFSGGGTLRKISAGTLTLSGESHHTGGVTIQGGGVSANHLTALGDGTTTIQSGTALGSTVPLVSLGGIDLQGGGTLSTNGSTVGAWNLTSHFFMEGGTYQLDITAGNLFDVVKGTAEGEFALLSGTINLALHSGFDYGLKYYVFDGFGLGNDTRDSAVLLIGYDAATYTGWIDDKGYLQFAVIPEQATPALLTVAALALLCKRRRKKRLTIQQLKFFQTTPGR